MNRYQALKTLNVDRNSSQSEIKAAYRKLALELHPDRNNKQEDDEFKKITEAYNFLKDNQNDNSAYQESEEKKADIRKDFTRKPQWGAPEDQKIPEQD